MLVLKIIGGVLLTLLLLLFVLAICLLYSYVRVDFRGKNGEPEIRVGIGVLRIKLWPATESESVPEEPKDEKPHKRRKKQAEKEQKMPDFSKLDYTETLMLLLDLLGQMKDKLLLETLMLNVVFATDDAAKTALLLGGSSVMAGMIIPFLEQNFKVGNLQMTFDANFEKKSTLWAAVVVFAVRPASVIRVLLKNRRALYALYKQVMGTEKEI